MNSLICDLLDIEFPLIAFSHCRDVVVEVSKAGGFGVLGAARYNASTLEAELSWIDEHIDGKPYGVDLIAPTSMAVAEENGAAKDLKNRVPQEYFDFASGILERHDIDASDVYANQYESDSFLTKNKATSIIDVAFDHPIKLRHLLQYQIQTYHRVYQ